MPMNTQVRTDLVISAQTKGFDKALRDTLGLSQKALDALRSEAVAFGKVDDKIKGLRSRVSQLAKEQLDLGRAMKSAGDQNSDAFLEMEKRLRAVRQESREAATEANLLSAAFSREAEAARKLGQAAATIERAHGSRRERARGAFGQGLLQTLMPQAAGMFLDRGPGMRPQAAGQLTGGVIRRGLGGLGSFLSTPFIGLAGFEGALQAFPGGGIAAGQLMASAGYAGQALQYQQARLGLSPFVGGADPQVVARARARVGSAAGVETASRRGSLYNRLIPGAEVDRLLDEGLARGARGGKDEAVHAAVAWAGGKLGLGILRLIGSSDPEIRRVAGLPEKPVSPAAQGLQRARQGLRRAQRGLMGDVGASGGLLAGMSQQESLQFVGEFMQRAGGRLEGEVTGGVGAQNQMYRTAQAAMAAKTLFGVDTGVSGMFGAAGRRAGSLIGAGGMGAESLQESLQRGVALGLEGSELTQYMQQVAEGIQGWERAGIPMADTSLARLAGAIAGGGGIAATRTVRMAGGLQQHLQTIGQRGLSSGLDLLALQEFGGYQGKGAGDYLRSTIKLEQMQGELQTGEFGSKTKGIIQRLVRMGGGGEAGVLFMRQQMQRLGMGPISGMEAAAMAEWGGEKTGISADEFRKAGIDVTSENLRLKRGQERAGGLGSVEALLSQAADRVREMAPNLSKQAAIQNQQLEVGSRILGTVQALEGATTQMNTAFLNLAGPTLTKVSRAMEDFAKTVQSWTSGGMAGVLRSISQAQVGLGR